ncbi:hypothetical protein M988_2028 [Hafnia paralvei ATCC 29927]|uniref:hypothetical protein n=1 Tax=Hafnia paralvei TaxID=546367 RepID=UPI0007E47218|nr:hypothetical protein [Hafnia paralvei]OAT41403.1 hypothetical protein M988_2028 [Hafnia paralvei ATCC 29927]
MNRLTTERLEKFVNDIKTDGMCDITDHQVELALRQLLAYEQAAKNPVAYRNKFTGQFFTLEQQPNATTDTAVYEPVFLAEPVLPKQPELVESLKKVMNNWLAMEPKLAFQPEFTDVMMLLDAEPAPAQPVSDPYKLKDAVADIRNSGVEIDADKIKAERDTLNSPVIPDGWKLVPIEPTAAMFHAFNDCDYGRKSMRERYIQMIEAAPAQESE